MRSPRQPAAAAAASLLGQRALEQEAQRPLAQRVAVEQALPGAPRSVARFVGQEALRRRRQRAAVEDLGARLGRVSPELVDLGPAAPLDRGADVLEAVDVREEELVDEVVGHVLGNVGALEGAGREQRSRSAPRSARRRPGSPGAPPGSSRAWPRPRAGTGARAPRSLSSLSFCIRSSRCSDSS